MHDHRDNQLLGLPDSRHCSRHVNQQCNRRVYQVGSLLSSLRSSQRHNPVFSLFRNLHHDQLGSHQCNQQNNPLYSHQVNRHDSPRLNRHNRRLVSLLGNHRPNQEVSQRESQVLCRPVCRHSIQSHFRHLSLRNVLQTNPPQVLHQVQLPLQQSNLIVIQVVIRQ